MTRQRLDLEMVRRGIVSSRQEAHEAIERRCVLVGGALAEKAARQVAAGDPIELLGPPRQFVSRGGTKLAHALEVFSIDVEGVRALDVGASTGGFTDCLLQRGAEHVYAVDVGHGQFHHSLREDPRVTLFEKLDARRLQLEHVGGTAAGFACADVSFISLRLVTPAIMGVVQHDASIVYLCKPQFEAARAEVGRGGIVRDPSVWAAVLSRLSGAFSAQNLYMVKVEPSPITGVDGNVEFLALCRKDRPSGRMGAGDFDRIAQRANELAGGSVEADPQAEAVL